MLSLAERGKERCLLRLERSEVTPEVCSIVNNRLRDVPRWCFVVSGDYLMYHEDETELNELI